jgi:hypothetical protein
MATLPFRRDMIISSGARYSGGHRTLHHNRRENIAEVSLGPCAALAWGLHPSAQSYARSQNERAFVAPGCLAASRRKAWGSEPAAYF